MKTLKTLWFLPIALLVGANYGVTPAAASEHEAKRDHLKCYQIKLPRHYRFDRRKVDLLNQFGLEEGCVIRKPLELCVPTEKIPTEPPSGSVVGHFIRYSIKCPKYKYHRKHKYHRVQVTDQFINAMVIVKRPTTLLVPALKDQCCGIFDRCIDADGIDSPGDGIPGAVDVRMGDPLASFPVTGAATAGVDWFDNDNDGQWTPGVAGDDLHSEDTGTCPTAIRDGDHDLGADCKILDLDNSLADQQQVNCDLELNVPFTEPHLSNGGCPSTINNIRYYDADGDGSWDNGEDIILDLNGNEICD